MLSFDEVKDASPSYVSSTAYSVFVWCCNHELSLWHLFSLVFSWLSYLCSLNGKGWANVAEYQVCPLYASHLYCWTIPVNSKQHLIDLNSQRPVAKWNSLLEVQLCTAQLRLLSSCFPSLSYFPSRGTLNYWANLHEKVTAHTINSSSFYCDHPEVNKTSDCRDMEN